MMYIDHRAPSHEYFYYSVVADLLKFCYGRSSSRSKALRYRKEHPDLKIFKYDGIFYVFEKFYLNDLMDEIKCAEQTGVYHSLSLKYEPKPCVRKI